MICSVCSYTMGETEAEDNELECCWACFHSGRYFEKLLSSDERKRIIPRLRDIKGIVSVQVIHLGLGQCALTIKTKDGKLIIPGEKLTQEANIGPIQGQVQGVAPMIMPSDEKWGISIMPRGWCGFVGVLDREDPQLVLAEGEYDDDELVAHISQMMELNALMEAS